MPHTENNMSILLSEWFDVDNLQHLSAYNTLRQTGAWPVGFIPSNVVVDNLWQVKLADRMAVAWLRHKGFWCP